MDRQKDLCYQSRGRKGQLQMNLLAHIKPSEVDNCTPDGSPRHLGSYVAAG